MNSAEALGWQHGVYQIKVIDEAVPGARKDSPRTGWHYGRFGYCREGSRYTVSHLPSGLVSLRCCWESTAVWFCQEAQKVQGLDQSFEPSVVIEDQPALVALRDLNKAAMKRDALLDAEVRTP